MDIREVPTDEGYDLWSSSYESDGNPMVVIEERHIHSLFGEVEGLEVIDLGCGTGRHSLRLAAMGASVTGVDFSRGMLEQARKKAGADKVKFVFCDLMQPWPFADRLFDLVVCALVLDHVAELRLFFREARRICCDHGKIVVTTMHPAMMLKGTQAGFRSSKEGPKICPQSAPNQVSDYIMAIVEAGLQIKDMCEYFGDEDLARHFPRARECVDWPMLISFELRP